MINKALLKGLTRPQRKIAKRFWKALPHTARGTLSRAIAPHHTATVSAG